MCGRFVVHLDARAVRQFGVEIAEPWGPYYNVAPTQAVPVVISAEGKRELRFMHWGLIPSWADNPAIGNRMINARAETVATKPAFRDAFRSRRCLVLASAFYEWQPIPGVRRKQPHAIQVDHGEPFAFAGLWDSWISRETGEVIESCTIITCEANAVLAPVHNRMPVILPSGLYDAWLDPATPPAALDAMLVPYPAEGIHAFPVSTYVNSPGRDGPECIAPVVDDNDVQEGA
jgi:putative SOS response-associated peptidase YedK